MKLLITRKEFLQTLNPFANRSLMFFGCFSQPVFYFGENSFRSSKPAIQKRLYGILILDCIELFVEGALNVIESLVERGW